MYLDEMTGAVVSGSYQVSGDSSTRRTLSLSIYTGTEAGKQALSINRKFRCFISRNEQGEECIGTYVATAISKPSDGMISITATDKMCLLNGSVSGVLEGVSYVDKVVSVNSDGEEIETKLRLDEIIYYVVAGLGGERRENIIISGIPDKIKSPMVYEGTIPIYRDENGNIYTEPGDGLIEIKFGDYIGYTMEYFYYPSDLIKQPGEPLTSILDDIKNLLGNHEYFYDVDGRFIFREMRNYLNNSFQNYIKLSNEDYVADLSSEPISRSITDDTAELISISSNSQWNNIKNNFIVWGTANGEGLPVCYHLVVDAKPIVPEGLTLPFQQYLINIGDANPTDPGQYYGELKSKFPQIYNSETGEWIGDVNGWNYFFDMIDAGSDYGAYSVSEIGKRTMSITDPQVGRLFSPVVPDFVMVNLGDSDAEQQMDYLISIGQKFISVQPQIYAMFKRATYSKSAYETVREMLYTNTTLMEQVSMSCIPLLDMEVNSLIKIDCPSINTNGEFFIKTISYSFGGTMNISATEVSRRT